MQIKTTTTRLAFVCLSLGVGGSGCGSNPTSTPLDPTAFGKKYKIADNEVSGWTQDPASGAYWTGTDLVAEIDGGNVAYDDRGFRQGMFQTLDGPDQQSCNLRAMDFGTEANATTMYTYEQQLTQASVPIPQYDASTAIGNSVISGVTAFAHFGASYFELALTGYADQGLAASVATQFLQVLQSKTK